MNEVFNQSISIDVCPDCWGTFFDYEEISKNLNNTQTTTDVSEKIIIWDDKPDHEGKILTCAACSNSMVEKEYAYDSGIHINFCDNCHSIYLDIGELEEVKNYLTSLDESNEWKAMEEKWLDFIKQINKETEAKYLKMRQELDNAYWIDDYLWLDKVADFFFRKFF